MHSTLLPKFHLRLGKLKELSGEKRGALSNKALGIVLKWCKEQDERLSVLRISVMVLAIVFQV